MAIYERVSMFTDGACLGNPGPGGHAAIIVSGPRRKELNGGFRLTTNNRMELMAVIVGLEVLQHPCEVVVSSDSQYVVQAMQKRWPQRWKANGGRLTDRAGKPGSGGLAKNPDLWERLLALGVRGTGSPSGGSGVTVGTLTTNGAMIRTIDAIHTDSYTARASTRRGTYVQSLHYGADPESHACAA